MMRPLLKKNPPLMRLCAVMVFSFLFLLLFPFHAKAAENSFAAERKRPPLYYHFDLSKKQYYLCKTVKQCVVVDMPCGAKVVVSSFFSKNIQGWYDFVAPRYKCATWLRPQTAKNITCTKNMCRADIVPYVPLVDQTPAGRDPLYCNTPNDCQAVVKSCGEKTAVNKKYGDKLQKQYDALKNRANCFHIDGQVVTGLTCKAHKCGVSLKPPVELPFKLHPMNPLEEKSVIGPNFKIPSPGGITPADSREATPK